METKTIEELQRLSDEKLKQLALQRYKGGRRKSTTTALRAQLVLCDELGNHSSLKPIGFATTQKRGSTFNYEN